MSKDIYFYRTNRSNIFLEKELRTVHFHRKKMTNNETLKIYKYILC